MYNKKQLKVENASNNKKKNPNMKGTHMNIQSSVNDMFMRNQMMFGPSGKRRYLPMEEGGEIGWLDEFEKGGNAGLVSSVKKESKPPTKLKAFGEDLKNYEHRLENWLDNPMGKAENFDHKFMFSKKPGKRNFLINPLDHEGPSDNIRHASAGYYASKAIADKFPEVMKYTGIPQITGALGSTLLGLGHELSSNKYVADGYDPTYTKKNVITEAIEDAGNNGAGAFMNMVPFLDEQQKLNFLKYLSANNMLPDGIDDPEGKKNMYWKDEKGKVKKPFSKQNGGELDEYGDGGGWLDQYDDGGSIVNYLSSKGQDYSKKGREALAKKMGIKDYDFSAEKNTELLERLKQTEKIKPMKEQFLPEVTITPWTKDINAYEKGNPKQGFIDSKKREYLNASGIRGLNKLAGLSSSNFPANKELEYINEYEYKKNNKLAPKIIASHGNPKDRSTWVEKLTPQEYEIVKNSDYRFELEPNAFQTTYAALNKMVSPMPNRYVLPAGNLTQNEMQNIGALNSFDFLNVPGQALGSAMRSPNLPGNPNNAYANNSMMKGLQGYHDPHRLEYEEIAANPLNWTAAYDVGALLTQAPKFAKTVAEQAPKIAKNMIYKGADLAFDNPIGEKVVNKLSDKRLRQFVPDTDAPQTLLPGDAEKIKELSTFINKHEELIKDATLNKLRAQGYNLKDARDIRDYNTAKFLGEYDFGNIPKETIEKITRKTSKEIADEYADIVNFKERKPKEGANFVIKPDAPLHGEVITSVDQLKNAKRLRKEIAQALEPIRNPNPLEKFYIEKVLKKGFKNKYKMDFPSVDDYILAERNQLIPTIESIDRASPMKDLFNASTRGKEMPKGVPFMGGASLSDNSFPIALKLTEKAIKEGKADPFFMGHGSMNNWGHLSKYANDPQLMLRSANESIKEFNASQSKVKLPYAYLEGDVIQYPRMGLKNRKQGGSVNWLDDYL